MQTKIINILDGIETFGEEVLKDVLSKFVSEKIPILKNLSEKRRLTLRVRSCQSLT